MLRSTHPAESADAVLAVVPSHEPAGDESEPALRGERLHEGAALGRVGELREILAVVVHYHGVVVLDEPGLDFVGEGLFFGREIEIHEESSGAGGSGE